MSTKEHNDRQFGSVAEFMAHTGLSDLDLAKLLDCDRSEATKLRLGRKFRSLRKPLLIAKKCRVPIDRLVA